MSRRSTPNCSDGLSLAELLVTLVVVIAITGAALTFALSARRLYDTDGARIEVAEALRTAREFVVTDLRQAGERLSGDFPAIEIIDGAAGSADRLVIRRNLSATVLRGCDDVDASTEVLTVGCVVLPDSDGDGFADNHQVWHERRLAAGGRLEAYLFDPVEGRGEFFPYIGDAASDRRLLVDSRHIWLHRYLAANQLRVYLLEERRYELRDGLLALTVNNDPAHPLSIVDHMTGLQATAVFRDGTRMASLTAGTSWSQLSSIEIDLQAAVETRGRSIERGWTGNVLPRNVLSR